MLDCALLKNIACHKLAEIIYHDNKNNCFDILKFSKCVRETYSATYNGDNLMRKVIVYAAANFDSLAHGLLNSPNFKEEFKDHGDFLAAWISKLAKKWRKGATNERAPFPA